MYSNDGAIFALRGPQNKNHPKVALLSRYQSNYFDTFRDSKNLETLIDTGCGGRI